MRHLRKRDAYRIYLVLTAVQAIALTSVYTVNLVYQVVQVGLNPLQLVLIGTTLELTAFLTEIPTGVVADVYSRRLSVIIGFLLLGIGFIVEGGIPVFEALLAAHLVMGVGYTFLSGATEAWIVDEIGGERANQAFMRGAQTRGVASFCAIFISVALAHISLGTAIVFGGALLIGLALTLALVMPEAGFTRRPRQERDTWRDLFATLGAGLALIRARRILLLILLATVIHGAFSEGFDRLWTARLLEQFALPQIGSLDEIVWFGLISAVSMPLGLGAIELLRRRLDLGDSHMVAKALMGVYTLMICSALLFALGEQLAIVMLGLWLTGAARAVRDPLLTAWINQHTASETRATVLSIQGQADAFGQIAGGPVVGAVGLVASLRLALSLSSVMLTPILLVFRHSLSLGATREEGDGSQA